MTSLRVLAALALAANACTSGEPGRRAGRDGGASADWTHLVGWYRLGEERDALVTWAAEGGLRLVSLDEPSFSVPLEPQPDGSFVWTPVQGPPRTVRFDADGGRWVSGFRWWGDGGHSGTATRATDQPYSLRALGFRNGSVPLSGTLLLPQADEAVPSVMMIHGSGDSDRNNRWYVAIADHLARNGIAVLLPDKRGCGQSGGDWRTAAMEGFAGDARAGIEAVRRQKGVDPARSGFLGVSQGGAVAPLAATTTPGTAFVVSLVSGVATFEELLLHESRQNLRQQGLPGLLADPFAPLAAAIARRRRPVWWEKNGDFDPLPFWRRVEAPKLLVYGAADERENVPVSRSVTRVERAGLDDLTLKVYPHSGHGLFQPGTRAIRPDFLELLHTWIHRHSAARAARTPGSTDGRVDGRPAPVAAPPRP